MACRDWPIGKDFFKKTHGVVYSRVLLAPASESARMRFEIRLLRLIPVEKPRSVHTRGLSVASVVMCYLVTLH